MSAAKGILIRPKNVPFLIEANFTDALGNKITAGTATATVCEVQQGGTLLALDFSVNPPIVLGTSGAVPTTATIALTNQSCGGVARSFWSATFAFANLTLGARYLIEFNPPAGATQPGPIELGYGSVDGDGLAIAQAVILDPTGLDTVIVEPSVSGGVQVNARQALSLAASASAGHATGLDTGNVVYYAAGNPTVPRINVPAADQYGNRPVSTITVS